MKKKNVLIFILSILLVGCLLYGLLRVIVGRQRRVNLDASMKYANIVSSDISSECYMVEITDEKHSYEDATYINCYFSSDKNDNNKVKIAVNSNGEIAKVTYYSLVDPTKSKANNIDNLNEKIQKISGVLISSQIKLLYGDFVNINSLPKSMVNKVNENDYKKGFKMTTNGNENNTLELKYVVDGKLGFSYLMFDIY